MGAVLAPSLVVGSTWVEGAPACLPCLQKHFWEDCEAR